MDIKEYNPSAVGTANGNYFGMPFTAEESALVLVSVPWGVTASYGGGQEEGPDAIIGASVQLDFYDEVSPNEWRKGIGTVPIDYSIQVYSIVQLRFSYLLLQLHKEPLQPHLVQGSCKSKSHSLPSSEVYCSKSPVLDSNAYRSPFLYTPTSQDRFQVQDVGDSCLIRSQSSLE